jgi:hypothetical protein
MILAGIEENWNKNLVSEKKNPVDFEHLLYANS